MSQELFLNGIDADTGGYITEGITTDEIAKVARGQQLSDEDKRDIKMRRSIDKAKTDNFGTAEGIDATDISQAGWSYIFPADLPLKSVDALKEALKPLLDYRQKQASVSKEIYFKPVIGTDGYKNGETKNDFLKRFGRGPGPADPEKFPYYTMIVGSPETIPYSFQYQLDVQYAVGRIYFEKLEDYYRYATSVVQAETKGLSRPRNAAFFGVANPGDKATQMSSESLIMPLATSMKTSYGKDWGVEVIEPDKATKANLVNYLGGANTPALLFTASHGMSFKPEDPRQFPHQGALLCQDWPGPNARIPITDQLYFSADDIPSDADVFGLIAFIFACYGGGTPKTDNFYRQAFGTPKDIAPYSFLAQLPTRLLCHPNGSALAVFAHVERAWGSSIMWDGTVRDVETFDSTVDALLNGKPAGNATEYFNERYAEISSDLATELDSTSAENQDDVKIAGMWTSNNDSRNYVLLGDPAVRLAAAPKETPKADRAKLGSVTTNYPAKVTDAATSFQPDVVVRGTSVKNAAGGPTENFNIITDVFKKPEPAADGSIAQAGTGEALKNFAEKLGKYLSDALDDATSLEVMTYVADDMASVKYDKDSKDFTGARLRAVTRINIDGDTRIVLPEKDGEVDTEVWSVHLDMVKQAQSSRTELMKTMVVAVTGLTSLLNK
jgi:hypothetical protein